MTHLFLVLNAATIQKRSLLAQVRYLYLVDMDIVALLLIKIIVWLVLILLSWFLAR